jgi:Ca2+-binding RTX toxin-like protein
VLMGLAGVDALFGGQGNDTLLGGLGNDYLDGGVGTDTASYINATGAVTVNLTTGSSNGAEGTDVLVSIESAIGSAFNDRITGTASFNVLTGAQGNDTLDGRAGNDTLVGGMGNDTFLFARGYGTDTIIEDDATLANSDLVQFAAGVAANQLWFSHVSNNLEVSVIGTTAKVVVKDWYLGAAHHVEQFKTTDGNKALTDTHVANLVAAMATKTPPPLGQTNLTTALHSALDAVIAANWQ